MSLGTLFILPDIAITLGLNSVLHVGVLCQSSKYAERFKVHPETVPEMSDRFVPLCRNESLIIDSAARIPGGTPLRLIPHYYFKTKPYPERSMKHGVRAVLVTDASYLPGILVLHQSLRKVGSQYKMVAHVLPQLDTDARNLLRADGIEIVEGPPILPSQYQRVVSMDADLLVFENVDDLMTMPLPEPGVACVPDCTCNPFKHEAFDKSWTLKNCAYSQQQPLQLSHTSRDNHHIFNSGVSMFTPSQANWDTLRNTLDNDDSVGSLLFGDQGGIFLDTLQKLIGRWTPPPYEHNAIKTLSFTRPELWDLSQIKIIHYTMEKPGSALEPKDFRLTALHAIWRAAFEEMRAAWHQEGKPHWDVIDRLVVQ
ncbi:nucleotide-diphospho-sugar transferase [Mycena metata]|uniref:Nucleotide-diphospho-sugar transferase n=1 Tax=Mycena metata TaxID=1033252 RepID=A0AAD7HT58_9AGAR|nr:nucleotide-diphospho-sugar transferase [Mycena metata]